MLGRRQRLRDHFHFARARLPKPLPPLSQYLCASLCYFCLFRHEGCDFPKVPIIHNAPLASLSCASLVTPPAPHRPPAQSVAFSPVYLPDSALLPFSGPHSAVNRLHPRLRFPLPLLHYCFPNLEKYMPTRDDAWKLLCEFTQSESLRKHMLAVEVCVRAYARKQGADEELWGLAALLHDFDYERWPNNDHSPDKEHPAEGAKILRERGYSDEIIRAILSHADYSGVPRQSPLEHTLFACDELAGFLTACSYVRPSRSILDLEADSVKRRLKDKAFARGVNREDVRKGAEELGIPLEEHIAFCIAAMREQADALGLRGSL